MKLKPMKFKQNGVRAESPKEKERNLGFCFSFFETQVHIKAGARTHTCVIWLMCRFSCLMTLDWLHQNNHRPQAAFSKPRPSTRGKGRNLLRSRSRAPPHCNLQLGISENTEAKCRFLLWIELLTQPLDSGTWFRQMSISDAVGNKKPKCYFSPSLCKIIGKRKKEKRRWIWPSFPAPTASDP